MIYLFEGYLPNASLAVEAMLATASIGATWSSTSPDFGVTVSICIVHIVFCYYRFDQKTINETSALTLCAH